MNCNIKNLGQFFTPCSIVSDMIGMIRNNGNILEPSAGDGAFALKLDKKKTTAIEYDKKYADKHNFIALDFFAYETNNKFDTVIGNPPYVRYQDIKQDTKDYFQNSLLKNNDIDYYLFDNRSNLYLFFIYKCVHHLKENGELIFITPRDFLKATSSMQLNKFIYSQGTITDIIELGDKKIFKDATPNTIIWRFEKDNFSRKTKVKKNFIFNSGQLLFTKNRYTVPLKEIAYVKVGAVSGADKCFEHREGINFVCSFTNKTQKTKRMLYNIFHKDLEPFKEKLLKRKIKKFDETNWYKWGRGFYQSNKKRIYVNSKTRNKDPFFISDIKAYDGSILAIFPINDLSKEQLKELCYSLNKVNWNELGFIVDGRFIFSQKSLENILLPKEFQKFKIKYT